MKNDLRVQVMTQQMSRKQFLQYVGGVLIVLLGYSHFINSIKHFSGSKKEAKHGFGSSRFGV